MNVLIDTNVVLDAGLNRHPHNFFAEKILLFISEEKLNGFITASQVTDIFYFLKKYYRDSEQAKHVLIDFFNILDIIAVTKGDCERAVSLSMGDYEDALLATCAKRKKLEFIITRNLKDFVDSPVKAINPEEFLTEYF